MGIRTKDLPNCKILSSKKGGYVTWFCDLISNSLFFSMVRNDIQYENQVFLLAGIFFPIPIFTSHRKKVLILNQKLFLTLPWNFCGFYWTFYVLSFLFFSFLIFSFLFFSFLFQSLILASMLMSLLVFDVLIKYINYYLKQFLILWQTRLLQIADTNWFIIFKPFWHNNFNPKKAK